MIKTRYWLAAVTLLGAALAGNAWIRHDRPKQQAKLETTFAVDTAIYARDTVATDSAINPLTPEVKTAVHRERKSAVTAIKTSEKLVKNLQQQLRPTRLKLVGEADYAIPTDRALLGGTVMARLGVELRVSGSTWVRAFRQQPIAGEGRASWNVGVRQEFRLH